MLVVTLARFLPDLAPYPSSCQLITCPEERMSAPAISRFPCRHDYKHVQVLLCLSISSRKDETIDDLVHET